MAQGRKASKVKTKINMMLYGDYFTGKTTLGLQMAMLKNEDGRPFRVLVLDAEQGGADDLFEQLEQNGVNIDNIYVVYTQSLEEVNRYIQMAANKEPFYELDENGNETDTLVLDGDGEPFVFDAILLDGTSVLRLTSQQSLLTLARRRAKVKARKNELTGEERALAIEDVVLSPREWGSLGYSGQSLVLNLAATGLHWIMTSREKAETEERIVNGQKESIATGKKVPDSFKQIGYNAKTVCRLYRDEDEPDVVKMFVEKDRTGVFAPGQVVENPSILKFQEKIDRSKNAVAPNVRNTMEEAIETDANLYRKSMGITDEMMREEKPEQEYAPMDYGVKIKELYQKLDPAGREEFKKQLRKNAMPVKISDFKEQSDFEQAISIINSILGTSSAE